MNLWKIATLHTIRLTAITLICSSTAAGVSAFALNLTTYLRPASLEPLLPTLYGLTSRTAEGWGILISAIAFMGAVLLSAAKPGSQVKYKKFVILMGCGWFFAVFTGAWFSASNSIRFQDRHWEADGQFQDFHRISEFEAHHLMWLNLRRTSAMVVGETATLLLVSVQLLGIGIRPHPGNTAPRLAPNPPSSPTTSPNSPPLVAGTLPAHPSPSSPPPPSGAPTRLLP